MALRFRKSVQLRLSVTADNYTGTTLTLFSVWTLNQPGGLNVIKDTEMSLKTKSIKLHYSVKPSRSRFCCRRPQTRLRGKRKAV